MKPICPKCRVEVRFLVFLRHAVEIYRRYKKKQEYLGRRDTNHEYLCPACGRALTESEATAILTEL